jgi:hypothetical protein
MDGFFSNRGEEVPDTPSWAMIARRQEGRTSKAMDEMPSASCETRSLLIDGSRMLLVLGLPVPQFKDKANGVAATNRLTGAPLAEVPLALTVEGGEPQVLR